MSSILDSIRNILKNRVINLTELEQYKYDGKFASRTDLNVKFSSLNNGTGDLDGLTLQEIVSVCGGFDIMTFDENKIGCSWQGVDYKIGISFDRNYKFIWVYNQEGSLSNILK